MTPAQRKILTDVRRRIQDGTDDFICHALFHVPGKNHDRFYLKCYISRKLGHHCSLGSWIKENRPNLSRDPEMMKEYRLLWIDWMLA